MSYPGNPSLASAVKDRVLSTFQQTLTLYKSGRTDEVAAGLNLLLQMDPMFDPARKLLEKMRNPGAPIDVDALLPGESSDTRAPIEQARHAMALRDFQRVIHLTGDILSRDVVNEEARTLAEDAREKLEAAPFVEQFTRKAEQNATAGNLASARMDLEKAKALDPAHPEVARVATMIAARDAAPAAGSPPPSFVVDDQAPRAGARSASQAADFGFTFEEDKPAEVSFSNFAFDAPAATDFSFDAAAPAPPPPKPETPFGGFSFDARPPAEVSEYDFATAAITTTGDDQKKIEQYLADGDRAFDAGDYPQAIDLWSRIFLIDVTNDVASDRIERAKAKRREQEQNAETVLAAGIQAFEHGDTAAAQSHLEEALRIDPRNTTAQDYLERLSDPGVDAAAPSRPYVAPPPRESFNVFADDLPPGLEPPLLPPDAPPAFAAKTASGKQKAAAAAGAPGRPLPTRLIAIVVGVLVLGAAAWFLLPRFTSEPVVEPSGIGQATIARASMLARNGDYDRAIALLQDIKPGDPQHDKAMGMIADLQAKKASSAQLIDGVPADQYFQQRIEAARAAFTAGDFTAAKMAFEQAQRARPLPPDLKAQYDAAAQQASKLDVARSLFAERKYTEAIASLQQLLSQEPQNASIQRMIGDARFNLAATALQEERTADAIRELDEVLRLNPGDDLARRSRELAQRYHGEPKDLLYKIYVKYVPLRAAN